MAVVLASASPIRKLLLDRAGVPAAVEPARIDEEAIRAGLDAEAAPPRDVAEALAELKARKVSPRWPGMLVLGVDQVLALGGRRFDKPEGLDGARAQLRALQGQTHQLVTAAVIVRNEAPIWRVVTTVQMTMRPLADAEIDAYLAEAGEGVLGSVGAYQFEGVGVRLFSGYRGDFFSVLGLPLLEVLAALRANGAIP